jgi:DNA mismatch endonuclease (patch repair protein)
MTRNSALRINHKERRQATTRSPQTVSYNMSRIKSKNTQIEKSLEEIIKRTELKYQCHYPVIGKPDFAFPEIKIAIFADSHFWHGYRWEEAKLEIHKNTEFWFRKIERNMGRDKEVNAALEKEGWLVIRFWEHEIVGDPDKVLNKICEIVKNRKG